jgi:hypothetical protein
MWINHTVAVLSGLLGWVALPISLVTMNLAGCLIGCTGQFVIMVIPGILLLGLSLIWPGIRSFALLTLGLGLVGLLILPALSLVWLPFYGITLWLSRLYRVAPWLSLPVGFIGIPFAVVGTEFVGMVPSMGEFEQKWVKQSICDSFPFSADFLEFYDFVKEVSPTPEGMTFSFDDVDLDHQLAFGGITKEQYERWSRIRSLTRFRRHHGPLRRDLASAIIENGYTSEG